MRTPKDGLEDNEVHDGLIEAVQRLEALADRATCPWQETTLRAGANALAKLAAAFLLLVERHKRP